MVWHSGTYDSTNDNIPPEQQLARGKIDIDLHGTKLRGGFSLVRTGKSSRQSTVRERWLLIKHRDEYADLSWDIESPRFDCSVLTGRSLKQIERGCPKQTRRVHAFGLKSMERLGVRQFAEAVRLAVLVRMAS
jgi:bifunctional non-homologous end joining protein LigD